MQDQSTLSTRGHLRSTRASPGHPFSTLNQQSLLYVSMVRVYLDGSSSVNVIVPGSCILDNRKSLKALYRPCYSDHVAREMRGHTRLIEIYIRLFIAFSAQLQDGMMRRKLAPGALSGFSYAGNYDCSCFH